MDSSELLLNPPVLSSICSNLTIQEAKEFRRALNVPVLHCRVPITDPDGSIFFLDRVDALTIQAAEKISEEGLQTSLIDEISNVLSNSIDFPEISTLVEILIHNGLNLNFDYLGYSPLWAAVRRKNLALIKFLIEQGADPNQITTEEDEEEDDRIKQRNALIQAVLQNNFEIAEFLLKSGANPNIQLPENHDLSPLAIAIHKENGPMVQLLLKYGADPNLLTVESYPLIFATGFGNLEIISMLLEKGADVNSSNSIGETALMHAVYRKNPKMVQILLAAGADKSKVDQRGRSARDYAQDPEIIQLLLNSSN